jgi:hypothetical protein
LDRLQKKDGLKELAVVMSKWNKGTSVRVTCALAFLFSLTSSRLYCKHFLFHQSKIRLFFKAEVSRLSKFFIHVPQLYLIISAVF